MKRFLLFILILLNVTFGYSIDYTKIDKQAESIPKNLKTVDEIARHLTRNLTSPTDKARAIYYWISHTIRYDLAALNSGKEYVDTQEIIDEVLQSKQGVCQHYAELFNACCQAVNVQSYVIKGYTRQNGEMDKVSHVWNAVQINSKYYEIDVTWAAGHLEDGKYKQQFNDTFFMIAPFEFIKTHMPFDPIWQFSNNPITHKEFEKEDFSRQNTTSNFNYTDSIQVLSDLNLADKTVRENRRITRTGVTNSLIREQVAQNQQKIVHLKYNDAVNLFNKGVENFNFYILSKNKQFNGATMADEKVLEMLSSTRQCFESAEKAMSFLNSDNAELNRSMRSMEKSIDEMKNNLQVEDVFVKKYIKTLKPFRLFLFVSPK